MDLLLRRRAMMAQVGSTPQPPYPDPWIDDGTVWAYYEATSTTTPTTLIYSNGGLATISSMEIDGVSVSPSLSYTFATLGEHLVRFTLSNNTVLGDTNAGIFRACNNLRRLYMPDIITTVNRLAFYQNSGVTFVRLSPNITTLAENVFYQTSSLSMEVALPNLLTIGAHCFDVTSITKITSLGSLASLPNSAIRQTSITDLVLPATLTALLDASVYGNSALKRVTVYATTPPSKNANVFSGSTLDAIYVPTASVADYKTASGWSSYASIIQAIP